MRRNRRTTLLILVVVLLAAIFLEPLYGVRVGMFLVRGPSYRTDDASLAAENEILKTQLSQLQGVAAELPAHRERQIVAMVYSRYPLNFKNEILVDVGTDQGVRGGEAVFFRGILIGIVKSVFPGTSLVQTVFDGGFKMPVRIGRGSYDALLSGGAYPKAVSIAKNAGIAAGDVVYAAAPGIPYAAPVALVSGTSTSPDNLFIEATLSFAYDISAIQSVQIARE